MANQRFLTRGGKHILQRTFCFGNTSLCMLVLLLGMMTSGCAPVTKSVTLKILDTKSKEPIEGAVAIAMWTRTRGLPGLTSRYTAKAIEAVSDTSGILALPPVSGRYAKYPPHLKIYKPGYIGWDSRLIYLGPHKNNKILPLYGSREGFTFTDQTVFLEPWKDEYTYMSHSSFIQTYSNLRKEAGLINSKYEEAIEYERPLYIKEKDLLQQGK